MGFSSLLVNNKERIAKFLKPPFFTNSMIIAITPIHCESSRKKEQPEQNKHETMYIFIELTYLQ